MNAAMANNTVEKTKVQQLQSKLYCAAKLSPTRRFHALFDKLHRIDVLERAWAEVAKNRGAPGVDGVTIESIEEAGVAPFLATLAASLADGTYRPKPVRRVRIEKPDGGERLLGVPCVADRCVQAAAKLLLEPIYEADFASCPMVFVRSVRPTRPSTPSGRPSRRGGTGSSTSTSKPSSTAWTGASYSPWSLSGCRIAA